MRRKIWLSALIGVAALGLCAGAGAATADLSGTWSFQGSESGASIIIVQHGDQFRVNIDNSDARGRPMKFVADGSEQQLQGPGGAARLMTAVWEGSELVISTRTVLNSKVRRKAEIRVTPSGADILNLVVTRGSGADRQTRNLVLERR
ncbi:MAG: hypothetical protein K8R59_14095 [Thermoanaerobaculales bacterium]|nr:hypothetical protein [Thermoanaerobaculales bacterium]